MSARGAIAGERLQAAPADAASASASASAAASASASASGSASALPPPAAWLAESSPLYRGSNGALVFSHALHAARTLGCVACHAAALTSRSSVDLLVPTEAACRACHAIDRGAASEATCGKCHRGFRVGEVVARVQSAAAALKLSHAAHRQVECVRCHLARPGVATPDLAAGHGGAPTTSAQDAPGYPSMASCLSCHRDGGDARRCTLCHLATAAGLIDTSLGRALDGESVGGAPSPRPLDRPLLRPTTSQAGDAHGPGFANDHRAAASRSDRRCAACHDESYCSDCHAGTIRPLAFHPDDYLKVHAIAAKRAASECSTCHRYQTFCVGCHERVGVGARAADEWSGGQGAAPFHPAGWASAEGGSNLHAREARRNLSTCASCHREDDCLACHSADAGGLGVTPHPRGWRGSAQCRALDRSNRRMCSRCHVSADELGCDWTRK
jgi:Cytochrome c7 and related cytochrome c